MDIIISPNDKLLTLLSLLAKKRVIVRNLTQFINNNSFFCEDNLIGKKQFKCSEFNFHTKTSTGHIIFNTLYNTLVRLSASEYVQYRKNQCNNTQLENDFVKNGLWVIKELQERKKYQELCNLILKEGDGPLNLTVTTTLECNAHCPYCYERELRHSKMPLESIDGIINFVKHYNFSKGIELTWFGGEPLMNTPFMDLLSRRFRREHINFSSYLITNGSLLTEELIHHNINKWNIKKVQISFDGTRKRYEQTKRFDNTKLGFQTIISSIHSLAKKGLNVHLRLNICYDNRDDIIKLTRYLDNEFSSYSSVYFYPAFITGERRKLGERERLKFIKELFKCVRDPRKLTFASRFHSLPRFCSCHATNPMSFTIDVYGNIFTCEHYVGRQHKAIGNIFSLEKVRDSRGKQSSRVFFEKCNTCVFFPKCQGGCSANRDSKDIPCFIDSYIIRAYLSLL